MKSKQYISKFKLDEDTKFDHSVFIEDLKTDFLAIVETRKNSGAEMNHPSFAVAIKDIRAKFNSIVSSSFERPEELWTKLWNYFFATVVCPTRDEVLGVIQ